MLGLARAGIADADGLTAIQTVDKVLKASKFEQKDKEVVVKSAVDVDVNSCIRVLKSAGGPFGGIGPVLAAARDRSAGIIRPLTNNTTRVLSGVSPCLSW